MPSKICQTCTLTISSVQLGLDCAGCARAFHANCCNMSSSDMQYLKEERIQWRCSACVSSAKNDDTPIVDRSLTDPDVACGGQALTVIHFEKLMSAIEGLRADCHNNAIKLHDLRVAVGQCNDNLESTRRLLEDSISSCRAEIDKLRVENSVLENRVRDLEAGTTARDVDMEELVREAIDRQKRAKNLIIFGLPESDEENREADNLQVCGLLKTIDNRMNLESLRFSRLGRRRVAGKSRPVKVTCSDEAVVSGLLSKTRNLKSVIAYKDVYVSADRTPAQVSLYRAARSELRDRVSRGESGLKVKTVRGVPKVISIANTNTTPALN